MARNTSTINIVLLVILLIVVPFLYMELKAVNLMDQDKSRLKLFEKNETYFPDVPTTSSSALKTADHVSTEQVQANPQVSSPEMFVHPSGVFCETGKQIFIPFKMKSFMTNGAKKCDICHLNDPITTTQVALRFSWLLPEHKPLRWNMFLHPPATDVFVSASFLKNEGNEGFESWEKKEFYEYLFPAAASNIPTPKAPVVLDVGANIGIHALFFGALKVKVHGFEPNMANYRILECSVDANPSVYKFMSVYNYGLSDKNQDKVCMQAASGNQGHAFVDTSNTNCEDAIELKTLDWFWENELKKEHVYMMKVDVEGFEPQVFAGGDKMLTEKPPLVIFSEITPEASLSYGYKVSKMLRTFLELGYEIVVLNCPSDDYQPGTVFTKDSSLLNSVDAIAANHLFDVRMVHRPTLEKWKKGEIQF